MQQHEKWTTGPCKHLRVGMNKKVCAVKQKQIQVVSGLSNDNLLHLSCRCLASFERRFLEECDKLLTVLIKNAFHCFESFLCHKAIFLVVYSSSAGRPRQRLNYCRVSCDHYVSNRFSDRLWSSTGRICKR
jgi:hypothetical protein